MPLKRRRPPRSKPTPQRVFLGHQQWVRGFVCCVPGCGERKTQFAHVRDSDLIPPNEKGGTGLKPHDKWGVPMCEAHHREQHQIGEPAFERKYGIDLGKTARQLAWQSPHRHKWKAL